MPYTIRTNYKWGQVPPDKINQLRKWLYCFVGDPYHHWRAISDNGQLAVQFIDSKDAALFSLKWL